ncbi:pA118R [African swine fever virus]|uniref:PA118R n=1 Tax=African swine fever virus TaxID=10497 RepID=A0A894KTV3_ASF|nr:pA118R [African swine fever virus]
MHSIAFFILMACVLFPTPLFPSMAICIPRRFIIWVQRIQFFYNIVQHYIIRIRCYTFIKYLLFIYSLPTYICQIITADGHIYVTNYFRCYCGSIITIMCGNVCRLITYKIYIQQICIK